MIKLINDDCVSAMKNMESESIDLTVTSPPYDNLRSYNGNNAQWGEHVWKNVLSELYRITKKGGVVVWVVGDATIKGSETGTSFKQALYAMECGFNLHDTMIWNKGGFSAVGALQTRYAPVFEYMFVFSKGKIETFNPIKDRKNKHANKKVSKTKRNTDGSIKRGNSYVSKEFGQRFNVWDINPHRQKGERVHPAPFPEKLAHDHIISWSNEGDVTFDPFMGSGTTGKMAKILNRSFVGVELEKEYFEMSKARVG